MNSDRERYVCQGEVWNCGFLTKLIASSPGSGFSMIQQPKNIAKDVKRKKRVGTQARRKGMSGKDSEGGNKQQVQTGRKAPPAVADVYLMPSLI